MSDVKQMVRDSIVGKTGEPPWQWVSFAGEEGFRGVAILRAWNVGHASQVAWEHGCNPGGEVMALEVPDEFGSPPPEWDHKLISDRAEVERLTERWHGCGIVKTGDILDDGGTFPDGALEP